MAGEGTKIALDLKIAQPRNQISAAGIYYLRASRWLCFFAVFYLRNPVTRNDDSAVPHLFPSFRVDYRHMGCTRVDKNLSAEFQQELL